MRQILDYTAKTFAILATLLIALLMLSTAFDVLIRNLFNSSVKGVVELSDVLLVAISFLGMAFTQQTKAHVKMEVLGYLLKPPAINILRLIGSIILLIILTLLTIATGEAFINSYVTGEYRTGLLSIPLWPSKLFITLGFFIYFLVVLLEVFDQAKSIFSKSKSGDTKIKNGGEHE